MNAHDKLKAFEAHRTLLIGRLEKGEIDKTSFIQFNHEYFDQTDHEPCEDAPSVEQCLYNYQYYNTQAKYAKMQSMLLKYKDPFVAVDFRKQAEKIYRIKERVTEEMIEICKGQDIEAYYIKISSKSLKGKIFEIVFKELDQVILHSMDERVKKRLIKMNCFDNRVKKSIIDEYINSLY